MDTAYGIFVYRDADSSMLCEQLLSARNERDDIVATAPRNIGLADDKSVLFTVEDPSENEEYTPVFPTELDGIVLRRGSGGLATDRSSDYREQYVDLLISIYRALPETPAAAYAMDPEQGFGVREGQENYPSPVTADSLNKNRFHDAAWVLFMPPQIVENYGRNNLDTFPTRRLVELDDGTVVLVANGDPSEYTEWRELATAMNAPAAENRPW